MTVKEFTDKYYPYAKQTEDKTGMSALAILAQCALETGWGKYTPGNMMFGIKATNWKGDKQLVTTTEYHKTNDVKYPEIISITKLSNGKYKYRVKDWFRKYATPEESFTDHARLIMEKERYSEAMVVRSDPYRLIEEIHKAGYATDPKYTEKLHKIINMIKEHIPV